MLLGCSIDHKVTDAFYLSFGGAGVKFSPGLSNLSPVAPPRRSSPGCRRHPSSRHAPAQVMLAHALEPQGEGAARSAPSLVAFTGGTAFNSVAAPLASLTTRVTHVLPVSDDGGSTAEIVRVLGGPALGDLRSRCLRLTDERGAEACAAQALLALRLHAEDEARAVDEWESVLAAEHQLWASVSAGRREGILRMLRAFDAAVRAAGDGGEVGGGEVDGGETGGAREVDGREANGAREVDGGEADGAREVDGGGADGAREVDGGEANGAREVDGGEANGARSSASGPFRFRGGSVGNFFLAAARSQCTSLDAAVQLLCETVGVPRETLVLPAVQTEGRLTLGAELEDGTHVRGQNAISHPEDCAPLTAAVRRVYYCRSEGLEGENPEGQQRGRSTPAMELFLRPHPNLMHQLRRADAIVFGMGSLFTSLCPSLILHGVGEAVAAQRCPKILILNSCSDRETSRALGKGEESMDAADCVRSVAAALNREGQGPDRALPNAAADYVTHLLHPAGGTLRVDEERLGALGVARVVAVSSVGDCQAPKANGGGKEGGRVYDPAALVATLQAIAQGRLEL